MSKKILVISASGFLGGKLCHALLAAGHSVHAFVHRTSDIASLTSEITTDSLEIAYGDITDLSSLVDICSGCHVIFHTAALVEPWLPDPARFFSVNVGGLKIVLEAFKQIDAIKKVIYTSSYFALGCTDGYITNEKQVHDDKKYCTEYENSKAFADTIAMQAASEGIPIILLSLGVIYGPGKITAGNIVARILIERFSGRLPGYIGSGNDKNSFCHVDDVVNGHIFAMHNGKLGERYFLTRENASFKHVFDIAAIITNSKRPWFHIPLWSVEIYGWILVFVPYITWKLPLISYPTVKVLRHQWAYSCEKARKELGFIPRNLNEGLTEMLQWLKSLGFIKY